MNWRGAEPILSTERLILRPFRVRDLEDLVAIEADPEVTYFRGIPPQTPSDSLASLRRVFARRRERQRKMMNWCVCLAADQTFLGCTMLRFLNRDWQEMEVGYCFAKAAWGQGYGTEATRATLDFAFQRLEAHRVIANCYPENKGSRRLLEKLRFREEAYQVESYFEHGAWQDNVQYALLAREWDDI